MTDRTTARRTNVYSDFTALALRAGAVNLGQGFPDDPAPAALLDAAIRAISEGHNQYPPTWGVATLREAIADHQESHYGVSLDPNLEVVVTTGASEAISAALLALLDPGDDVLVIEPAYDLYAAAIELAHGRVVWVPSIAQLAEHITPRARVVIINSPCNPSGEMLSAVDLKIVSELAERNDLVVISDEVYEHILLDDLPHVSAHMDPQLRNRTLVVSSAAKTLCVTGWKVGWATGPAHLVAAVHDAKQYLSFAAGTPFQYAVAEGLADMVDHIEALRSSYREHRRLLTTALERVGYQVSRPNGGYFVMADARPLGVHTTIDLWQHCLSLPESVGIVGIPGSVFMKRDDVTTVRFCFAKSRERIDEATARLAAAYPDA